MFNVQKANQLVKQEGRTAEWLAEYCKCNKATVQGYLTGRLKPSAPIVKLLSFALNCPEADLLKNESPPTESL